MIGAVGLKLKKTPVRDIVCESSYIFTFIFPLALSMAVCSGIGVAGGLFGTVIACLLISVKKTRLIMPVFSAYLIVAETFRQYGASTTAAAVGFAGILMIAVALSGFDFKKVVFKPVLIAVMLASAISVTVLETTLYFGIGATGNTVGEMIESYRSLGFHPNWRGILYGTIVMVIMITYPRKFKKADSIVRAPFVALAATLVLNVFLNPADMTSAIREIGTYSFAPSEILFPAFKGGFSLIGILTSGISLFVITAYSVSVESNESSDYAVTGGANLLASVFTGAFVPFCSRNHKKISLAGIPAAVLTVVILFFFRDVIARIPVASCAVILIVGAWQSVRWGEIKKAFIDVPSLACLIAVTAFMLLFGAVRGMLFGALCSFLCSFLPSAKHFINDN